MKMILFSATMVIDGLTPSTTYKLSLTAKSTTGLISLANYYTVTTAPDPPIEFKPSIISPNEVTLTWIKPVAQISKYILRISSDTASEERNVNSTKSSETVTGLKPGTDYRAELRSIPAQDPAHSPPSIISTLFTTHLPSPDILTKTGTENSVIFDWTTSYSDQIAYHYVLQNDQMPSFTEWTVVNVTEKSYEIPGLQSDALYLIEVKFIVPGVECESTFFDVKTKMSKNQYLIANPTISAVTFRQS